jgi:hypothetical protein
MKLNPGQSARSSKPGPHGSVCTALFTALALGCAIAAWAQSGNCPTAVGAPVIDRGGGNCVCGTWLSTNAPYACLTWACTNSGNLKDTIIQSGACPLSGTNSNACAQKNYAWTFNTYSTSLCVMNSATSNVTGICKATPTPSMAAVSWQSATPCPTQEGQGP